MKPRYLQTPKFKIGERVMFAKRCQNTSGGMKVEAIDETLFGMRFKVDDKWWVEANFITFAQWKKDCLDKAD